AALYARDLAECEGSNAAPLQLLDRKLAADGGIGEAEVLVGALARRRLVRRGHRLLDLLEIGARTVEPAQMVGMMTAVGVGGAPLANACLVPGADDHVLKRLPTAHADAQQRVRVALDVLLPVERLPRIALRTGDEEAALVARTI